MRAIFSRSLIFSCLLSLVVLSPSTSAFASPSSRNATSGCSHLHVHLNGNKPPTQTCLNGQVSTNAVSAKGGCTATDVLILWWDANFNGESICFTGTGATDLDSYPRPALAICVCTSWDKQASSFAVYGLRSKTIYSGIGESGQSYTATGYIRDNLANTPVGDDNASSIELL